MQPKWQFQFNPWNTLNNKKYSNSEYWGKIQEYLNYSTDILQWKMFRIYKLFPAYSVSEKWSEYLKISNTFLAQNRLHFPGHLFFWGAKISGVLTFPECLPHRRDARTWCDMPNVNNAMHTMHMMWCTHTHTHHMQHGIVHCIVCIMSCTSCASDCACRVHHVMCAMCVALCMCILLAGETFRKNKHPGKISAPENVTYSESEKCWKFSNILFTSLVQNMLGIAYIFWTFSILEYWWNSLNIPGIFPQYSAFEFLLFTVYSIVCWEIGCLAGFCTCGE